MAAEARLRKLCLESLTKDFLDLTQQAEDARARETRACVLIQSAWRGHVVRHALSLAERATLRIQRWWRGYVGRLRAHMQAKAVAARLRQRYFDEAAARIQCHWRGYYSRKHKHNYYKRKAFLQAVLERTIAVRGEIAAAAEAQVVALAAEVEAVELARFEDSLRGRHHLLSTANSLGVFRAPYWQQGGAGDAIEHKLRGAEERGWSDTLGQPGGTQPAAPPLQPRYRASIGATEHFGAEVAAQRVDRAVSKLLLRDGVDFHSAARKRTPTAKISLNASLPFKPPIRQVSPDRSLPQPRPPPGTATAGGTKPHFANAVKSGREFDFYDTTMQERPPGV